MSIYIDPTTTDPGVIKTTKTVLKRMFNAYMVEVSIERFELTQTILDWYVDVLNDDLTAFNNIPTDVQTAYDGVLTPIPLPTPYKASLSYSTLWSGSASSGSITLSDSISNYDWVAIKVDLDGVYQIHEVSTQFIILGDDYAYSYANERITYEHTTDTTITIIDTAPGCSLLEVYAVKLN